MSLVFDECSFQYPRGSIRVLERLSVEFGAGRTILLGPNGAGKSTILGLGASALVPSAGRVLVGHLDSRRRGDRRPYRCQVGWMPQQTDMVRGLRVREQVAMAGWLKGLSRSESWERAEEALRAVDLLDLSSRPTHRLSGGQKARVGLAQTLVHDAAVVLLDEPVAALDPTQRLAFLELLGKLAEDRTVIVSTHDVNDLAESFDQVLVISGGRVGFFGGVSEFMAMAQGSDRPVDAYRVAVGGMTP